MDIVFGTLLGTSKENMLLKTSRIFLTLYIYIYIYRHTHTHAQCYNINDNVLIFRGSWIGLCFGVKKRIFIDDEIVWFGGLNFVP